MILNLDPTFTPIKGPEIDFESFTFNGGEPHIRIKAIEDNAIIHVTHRVNSFNDLGLLCVAIDALKRMNVEIINLTIPYFPAARQDRLMTHGEALTVRVYTDIINAMHINAITIFDPHSDVTPALLNNCTCIPNNDFIKQILPELPKDTILVSPDAGASKKVYKLAHYLGHEEVLECGKTRNTITGELSGFSVPSEDLNMKPCLIVDDICDGGGTFIGLASELKKKNAGALYLAVSHGIFSKGYDSLLEYYDIIYTTDSIKTIDHKDIKQITLNSIL